MGMSKHDTQFNPQFEPQFKLISHRGASAYAPENTLAALTKAYELGAKWIEADIRLTLDGEAVIFHDDKLDRCTNGHGLVSRTPYSVIASLDAGSWFGPNFAGEKVPTLDQWLIKAAELGLGVVLDLKGNGRDAKRLIGHLIMSLARYWKGEAPAPIISSAQAKYLRVMAKQNMGLELAYITNKERGPWKKIVRELKCKAVHIDHHYISPRWIELLKKENLQFGFYTVSGKDRALQLLEWGADRIFTNDTNLLNQK